MASGILPDVEGGILPSGKGGRNIKCRQNYQPANWFCPPGWKPGSTAGRDARRYIKRCFHARFNFGIRVEKTGCGGWILQSELFQDIQARFFLARQGVKKTIAVQRDVHRQAREIGHRFHVGDDQFVNADGLLAVVLRILQVNELHLADGDVQHVNAREIEAGLFFEIRQRIGAAAGFLAGLI